MPIQDQQTESEETNEKEGRQTMSGYECCPDCGGSVPCMKCNPPRGELPRHEPDPNAPKLFTYLAVGFVAYLVVAFCILLANRWLIGHHYVKDWETLTSINGALFPVFFMIAVFANLIAAARYSPNKAKRQKRSRRRR